MAAVAVAVLMMEPQAAQADTADRHQAQAAGGVGPFSLGFSGGGGVPVYEIERLQRID